MWLVPLGWRCIGRHSHQKKLLMNYYPCCLCSWILFWKWPSVVLISCLCSSCLIEFCSKIKPRNNDCNLLEKDFFTCDPESDSVLFGLNKVCELKWDIFFTFGKKWVHHQTICTHLNMWRASDEGATGKQVELPHTVCLNAIFH